MAQPFPLVVDIDGGLLAGDPVRDALRQIRGARRLLRPPRRWEDGGRPPEFLLQDLLAQPGAVLPRIPVRPDVLDAIGLWRRFGSPVALISQLPEAMVAHLRDALCPGAAFFGARPTRPLDSAGKAALLAQVYGLEGFMLIARATGSDALVMLARRATLVGLTAADKRRFLVQGVPTTALPAVAEGDLTVQLRAGPGGVPDWSETAGEERRDPGSARPETRPPSRDVSDAPHSRTGRGARS